MHIQSPASNPISFHQNSRISATSNQPNLRKSNPNSLVYLEHRTPPLYTRVFQHLQFSSRPLSHVCQSPKNKRLAPRNGKAFSSHQPTAGARRSKSPARFANRKRLFLPWRARRVKKVKVRRWVTSEVSCLTQRPPFRVYTALHARARVYNRNSARRYYAPAHKRPAFYDLSLTALLMLECRARRKTADDSSSGAKLHFISSQSATETSSRPLFVYFATLREQLYRTRAPRCNKICWKFGVWRGAVMRARGQQGFWCVCVCVLRVAVNTFASKVRHHEVRAQRVRCIQLMRN